MLHSDASYHDIVRTPTTISLVHNPGSAPWAIQRGSFLTESLASPLPGNFDLGYESRLT